MQYTLYKLYIICYLPLNEDFLCRSVQAEALRILLPVWRGDLTHFPENAARSLMKAPKEQ